MCVERLFPQHGLLGPSVVVECPKNVVGRVIGKGGETIKSLQRNHKVSVQIDQSTDPCKVRAGR